MREIARRKEKGNEKERGIWSGISGCDTEQ